MKTQRPKKPKVLHPALNEAVKNRILEKAMISRFVEERLLGLFSEGKLFGTVHTCIGQEFSGAVVSELLKPQDTIFSNHRCHGHFLSRTGDIDGLIAELMGRQTGVCGGLGGSQHLCKDGFFSNGIQGGIIPVAAGLALGHKLKKNEGISVVFIGDGTLGEGVLYEVFNLASKWSLPLFVVLEDNKYSQSTSQHETLAGNIEERAAAFGLESGHADTWNWRGFYTTAKGMIDKMRLDSRPRFLHLETYRLKPHSKGDDTRPRDVIEPFEKKDPLNLFLNDLSPGGTQWAEGLKARVQAAVEKALTAPFAVLPREVIGKKQYSWSPAPPLEAKRVVAALNETLKDLMAEHQEVFFMGEDILSPYGGAFKASQGLSDVFPDRVRNTPISEACVVGMGTGLGLMPFFPIVEIMFGDFIGLAFDQIVNHAAKFQQMYNQQISTNVIVRTPMGGGRGYGPTHSQTLDKHFFGVPGLRILAMNNLTSPRQLYRPLIAPRSGPTLAIENKLLYGGYLRVTPPAGFRLLHSDEAFPTAWVKPESDRVDITLLGYGGVSEMLVEACDTLFEEHDLIAQALCVMQVYPFQAPPLMEILGAAPNLLIVEEGQGFAGFGAEVAAQLAETPRPEGLRIRRFYPPAHCIPSSGPLEKTFLPSTASIVEETLRMVRT